MINVQSRLRDIVVGKIQGEWKKIGVGGKNIFQMFCIPSSNFCILLQRYLRSLAKPIEFGQTLPVYFTACSGYSLYVHNEFCFELALNKVIVIQSVISSRHGFGTF